MGITASLPVRPILNLFRQNNTEALWMAYDEVADVLYVNFERPAAADHSEMESTRLSATQAVRQEIDTILRYQGDSMIGFTILNASSRE
ncbi:MAG: DUF2283 domain-containing protein [Alkalispirochaeta sp.]